jgi:hypothetical protein
MRCAGRLRAFLLAPRQNRASAAVAGLEPDREVQAVVEPPVLLRAPHSGEEVLELTRQVDPVNCSTRVSFLHFIPLCQTLVTTMEDRYVCTTQPRRRRSV